MAQPVEASSLSDITSIATNPPKYPINPTEQKRPPLTLYIVRVPGSSDFFLTPMKPQTKDVTAQDVLSSLYFFHLDTEDDARLLKVNENEPIIEDPPPAHINGVPPRKPLPPSARSSLEVSRHLEPSFQSTTSITERNSRTYQTNPQRPLGPRPLTVNASTSNPEMGHSDSRPLPQTHVTDSTYMPSSARQSDPPGVYAGDLSSNSEALNPFSITVFRRDPSSGGQWNVAKIVGQALTRSNDGETKSRNSKKRSYFTFSISLATPGYNKFQESNTIPRQIGDRSHEKFLPLGYVLDHNVGYRVNFHRQVDMEWSSPKSHAAPSHSRDLSDAPAFNTSHTKLSSHSPAESSDKKIRPKGYAFTSPWGSRCTFSTSTSGRSLKCFHTLGSPAGMNNPNASPSSIEVSELRFDLPLHGLFKSAASSAAEFEHFMKEHRRSRSSPDSGDNQFSTSRTTPHGREPHDKARGNSFTHRLSSDEERLDLSLGQEKAGGGIKGDRPKHGKLIIYDQGFKMLDLAVAANMAIFWSVWKGEQHI
ncbi:hypothetical protein F5884DRAFT_718179 [Xylogone sp. PMI_703]|nr:hypothetical protein F5884DRAFT_718179 [Xylogone sp. PMI_703]